LDDFLDANHRGGRVAWIPTAVNAIYPAYALESRRRLEDLGLIVLPLELEHATPDEVQSTLDQAQVVFVEGGNAFYLLHHARRSGFAEILPPLLDRGACVYVGVSAGAVVLGPDLWPATQVGREVVPALESTRGLGLLDIIVIPHHNDPARTQAHSDSLATFGRQHRIVFLDDDQAVEVNGDDWRLVYSP